jgi:hypothetical protein
MPAGLCAPLAVPEPGRPVQEIRGDRAVAPGPSHRCLDALGDTERALSCLEYVGEDPRAKVQLHDRGIVT